MYALLWKIPFNIKYPLGKAFRTCRNPYSVLKSGGVIVQVGCPWDLMLAGRSRGIYFSLFAGDTGRVIILEPDSESVKLLKQIKDERGLKNITIVASGVWSKKATLRFMSNPDHPAANLIEEVFNGKRSDRDSFAIGEIAVDSLDNILNGLGIHSTHLISITTNGSEAEILKGAEKILENTEFVSIVGDRSYDLLGKKGFVKIGNDDRGALYRRSLPI